MKNLLTIILILFSFCSFAQFDALKHEIDKEKEEIYNLIFDVRLKYFYQDTIFIEKEIDLRMNETLLRIYNSNFRDSIFISDDFVKFQLENKTIDLKQEKEGIFIEHKSDISELNKKRYPKMKFSQIIINTELNFAIVDEIWSVMGLGEERILILKKSVGEWKVYDNMLIRI